MDNQEERHLDEQEFDPYKPHKIKWWGWPLLVVLIVGSVYIFLTEGTNGGGQSEAVAELWTEAEVQKAAGNVFGTIYHITYKSTDDLSEGIARTLDEVDNSLSPFNKRSTITSINECSSMKVDSMFSKVFTLAKQVSEQTDGAFDITVAPLVNLWGFGFKSGEEVSETTVDSLMRYVGFEKVDIQGDEVVKRYPQTMLDCSAIAKGFGVDAVGEYLEGEGVDCYMVEIGGEVRLRGHNPKGMEWSIGVTKPTDDSLCQQGDLQQVIRTTDRSMATSGNYRNFYMKDGKKYAHTIDPRTGHPVQHNILSSTVIARDCATADAYATAFMVQGLDAAKKVLDAHKELEAYFICSGADGETVEWSTEGMKKLLK